MRKSKLLTILRYINTQFPAGYVLLLNGILTLLSATFIIIAIWYCPTDTNQVDITGLMEQIDHLKTEINKLNNINPFDYKGN